MLFNDISLEGSKRSFIVESFTVGGYSLLRAITRFTEESIVRIVRENDRDDGPIPTLQLQEVPGLENVVREINRFLLTFSLEASEYGPFKHSPGLLLSGAQGTGKTLL